MTLKLEQTQVSGSFKARGMAMAISKAKEFGITKVAIPTAGNAGGAMAAYAARAGMEAWVFMPQDTPVINPLGFPLLNTLILLCSGTTVTWAHHSLINGDRQGLKTGLLATIALGIVFSAIQAYEYAHAPFAFTMPAQDYAGSTWRMSAGGFSDVMARERSARTRVDSSRVVVSSSPARPASSA